MKIDLEALDFEYARGGRHIVDAMLAEDGDRICAVKLLEEVVFLLREGKGIPEITRLTFAKHLERIARNEPLHFFDYKVKNRSENLYQKLETYHQVEDLTQSKEAKNIEQAANILHDTIYPHRSTHLIKKDYRRGKKLAKEYRNKLLNRK